MLNNYRGVPDVAFNADLNMTYILYVGFYGPQYAGFASAGGGTSASTANWGRHRRLSQSIRGSSPRLPESSALRDRQKSGAFHDMIFGTNSYDFVPGFMATRESDFTTGWGSPNLEVLFHELAKPGTEGALRPAK